MNARMLVLLMRRSQIQRGGAQFEFESRTAIAAIRTRPTAMRQIREALVRLMAGLGTTQDQGKRAYLVLIHPEITTASLQKELDHLQAALRPELAERLHLITADQKGITGFPEDVSESDLAELILRISQATRLQRPLPRPDMRSEALRVIIHQWLLGSKPLTFDGIAKTVGCTYRTVAAVVERLGPIVERTAEQGIRLRSFPEEAWTRFIAVSRKARATTQYVDRSGQPRSAEFLVRRLQAVQSNDIAIGGVMGAAHHDPDLDMVSAPRLDLCVHAHGKHFDLKIIDALDPGLERVDHSDLPPRVVLHFLRRKVSLFERDQAGNLWADPVECLADLYEARLIPQAEQFESFLINRRSG